MWIGIGLVVFYGYSRKRDRAYAQLVAVREAAERREYRILACVGSLSRAEIILQAAAAVARHYDGEMIVLSVVEVPDRDLLAQGMERGAESRASARSPRARPAIRRHPRQSRRQDFPPHFLRRHGNGAGGTMQPDRDGPRAARRA